MWKRGRGSSGGGGGGGIVAEVEERGLVEVEAVDMVIFCSFLALKGWLVAWLDSWRMKASWLRRRQTKWKRWTDRSKNNPRLLFLPNEERPRQLLDI